MTEEQYLMEQIRLIQAEYHKAVQPYVDRLAYLKSLSVKPIFIDASTIPPAILDLLKEQSA